MKGEIDSDIKGPKGRVSPERFAALSVERGDISLTQRKEKERSDVECVSSAVPLL